MLPLIDCHTHTVYSQHGEGRVCDVVQAAYEKSVSVLALTEHYPLPDGADPTNDSAMTWEMCDTYRQECAEAKERFPQIKFLYGTEIDYLGPNDPRDLSEATLAEYEYKLLSVHFIDGWAFDNNEDRSLWEERGIDYLWKRYASLWTEAAMSSIPAHTMSHPDLIKKYGYYPSFNLEALYKEMLDALQASGRMIELNTAGLRYGCSEMYPSSSFLSLCAKANIPCTVGSDAHKPERVAAWIREAYATLYAAGYRRVAVPLPDGDRAFLDL